MDFDLSEEQQMLQQTTRKLMEKEITPILEKLNHDQPIPKAVIQEMLKKTIPLGIMGNTMPEEEGGAGLDYLTWGLMYERIDPFLCQVITCTCAAAETIAHFGTPEQKKKYLPELLNADTMGSMAITEPNVGSNPAEIQTRAVRDGDDYVINGTKMFITNGNICDIAIVVASVDRSLGGKGLARFIVDRRETPFKSRGIETISRHELAEVVFEDVRVPKENMIGNVGDGLKGTLKSFMAARCFVALNAVNISQRAIDASIKYAQERKQFGKLIGSFQLIQEMISDMITEMEAARLLAYRGLAMVDKGIRCNRETPWQNTMLPKLLSRSLPKQCKSMGLMD